MQHFFGIREPARELSVRELNRRMRSIQKLQRFYVPPRSAAEEIMDAMLDEEDEG